VKDLATGKVLETRRLFSLDEGARADTSLEGLAKLRTVFSARGSVTAGNSSQTSDGAGALILASESAVKRFGLKPLARFVSYAACGVPPHIMGIGPIEAIPAALRRAGLKQDAIDWFELNEAFAAQSLAVINTLGLDPAKALSVMACSSGQSWIASDRMPRALAGDFAPRAHMTLLEKDTALAVQAAESAGFTGPLGPLAAQVFARASAAGLAEWDDAAVLTYLRGRS
jgi:hypothetical protein